MGLTDAIHWFGAHGYNLSLPLIDAQSYDLVVDDGESLQRAQVKTTTQRSASDFFMVQLCTNGGNQSFRTTKQFDPTTCELLYVLADDGHRFLIPTSTVAQRTSLTLNHRFGTCRVDEKLQSCGLSPAAEPEGACRSTLRLASTPSTAYSLATLA